MLICFGRIFTVRAGAVAELGWISTLLEAATEENTSGDGSDRCRSIHVRQETAA